MGSKAVSSRAWGVVITLALLPGALCSSVWAQSGEAERLTALRARAASPGGVRVIVELRAGSQPLGRAQWRRVIVDRQERVLQSLRKRPPRALRRFREVPGMALSVDSSELALLERSPWVRGIQEDRLLAPHLTGTVGVIGADATIAAGWDGSGTHVAVLDTGVDSTHPFLTGRVAAEACFSANGSCPDASNSQTGAGAGAPCDFATACYHGTHVAGIVAGGTPPFSGVAPDASVIAVRVFSQFTGSACDNASSDPCAMAYTSDIVAGLEHVLDLADQLDIAAVNMSLGEGAWSSQVLCDLVNPVTKGAIDALLDAGIVSIVSSGNAGETNALSSPACISSVVSVGATSDADVVASFSNSASFLSLLAPGVSVASSVPPSLLGFSYGSASGTSMAAPHVAGAWAAAREAAPTALPADVLTAFQNTGVPITGSNGVTTPRIDLQAALTELTGVVVGPPCPDDADGDEVCDSEDNCLEVENPEQRDNDSDGYGNLCDGDFDGNGTSGGADFIIFRTQYILPAGDPGFDPAVDLDSSGSVGSSDFVLFRSLFGTAPGPSGLSCAGQPPCPVP